MLARELKLLRLVDFFHVTNVELGNLYSNFVPFENFGGVLHDLTSLNDISIIRQGANEKLSQVVWVGNSKWGSRSGYVDYKGYQRVISPLKALSDRGDLGFALKTVDLARKRIPHKEVLKIISESEILLVASDFEGTGLPILEAMAFSTFVITTNVGIAPEIVSNKSVGLIVDQSPESFYDAIRSRIGVRAGIESIQAFEQYFENAKNEKINPHNLHSPELRSSNLGLKNNYFIRFKWLVRYLRNLK